VVALDESGAIPAARRLLGPRRGPFGFLVHVTAGGLTGFGGGVTLLHDAFLGTGNRMKIRTQNTVIGTQRYILGLRMLVHRPDQIELGAGYRVTPNARYFGLGPEARRSDRASFLQEMSWVGLSYSSPPSSISRPALSSPPSAPGAARKATIRRSPSVSRKVRRPDTRPRPGVFRSV
jgi:hypothetical protein